ncbi:MAG TPA: cyanophycin synthetase [Nannocystaceae bacterium]|nr:cyanophycin synthetase [Nannocystaceae bacterium]
MKILERRIYRGPNLYAHFPVIRLRLDLGELEEWPTAKLPGFVERLLAVLPTLEQHTCSYGTHGGFLRRMREDEGTWMGHVLEHVAIEIQVLTGAKVSFGKTRSADADGVYHVVYEFEEERVGEAAGQLALRLCDSLLPQELRRETEPLDFARELDDLIVFAERRQFGPSTASIIRAAEERDIPWIRLNDYSLVQLGHGRYQKRIQATVTSETRHIAVDIASDKEATNKILADLGLPVPRQYVVRSAERAVESARRLGYPVVVKPLDANHGRGVSINLGDDAAVALAFDKAAEHARHVIVETYIAGFDHRMLVVDGELIAVAKRVPGHVVGDGERTIAELVDIVNQDPRRGIGHEKVLTRIELDYQAKRLLEQAGLDEKSVLPKGEIFYLRSTGNLSTGGTAIDLTDVVHPDNREVAIRAARGIGLDVAGIDFISPDISQSHTAVGGAICEVNAAPGFRMHVSPTEGTPRDVAGPVIEMLFPNNAPSRIPIAAVTGTNGKTTVSRMLAHIQKMSGFTVGLCTTDGVYIDGERTVVGDMTGPMAAQMVLRDPRVDFAVLETARGGLLRAGMGYRSCNVGCVLNVSSDHLGMGGIDSLDQLAEVKRIVVEVARDCAVLNADDERVLLMGGHTEAKRIAYITMNPKHDLVRQHIRAGGAAAVLEEGINGYMIALYDRGSHIPLLWAHLIPATLEAKAMFNVQNAMAAALMAFVMGCKVENIRQGLRTFDTTYFQAPGRLNVFDKLPFRVILDYGHNPAAVRAMADLSARLDVAGQRVCVLAAPGDRRDEDLHEIAKAAAGAFERFVLRTDDDTRGRDRDQITGLLRKGLVAAGVDGERIAVIPDEQQAIDAALTSCNAGDLLVIFGDKISRSWKQITKYRPDGNSGPIEVADAPAKPEVVELASNARPWELGGTLVEDERGVRIVRESED